MGKLMQCYVKVLDHVDRLVASSANSTLFPLLTRLFELVSGFIQILQFRFET